MGIRDGSQNEPLKDVLVVDLTHALAGPYATMMLADLGARVIKVERPARGDDARHWGPPFVGPAGAKESTYFLSINRNKESVALDLHSQGDRKVLIELVRRAHVLVENFRPGVMDRLGLGTSALHAFNPRLVVLSITGFGHDGPEADRPGYDQIVQGEGGLMSLTGPSPNQPTKIGVPITDVLAGMFGATGVLAALRVAERTGRGDVVRTSLLAAAVAVHTFQGTRWLLADELPRADDNQHPTLAPYGAFNTQQGMIQVAVGSDETWKRLCRVIGLDPADPPFSTNANRLDHRQKLTRVLEACFSSAVAENWLARLRAAGVPAGLIRTLDQVYASEQLRAQGLILKVDHPTLGQISLPGPAWRLDKQRSRRHQPPPRLGEQDTEIRTWVAARADNRRHPAAGVDLLARIADPRSFEANLGVTSGRARSSDREAVLTGRATIAGIPIVLILCDFSVRAGTMGAEASERVAAAFEVARAECLPVAGVVASGGLRIQEGPVALLTMLDTVRAARRHAEAGGLFLTYWAHPSTGGVLGSWGGLGLLRFAAPGGTVALTGPRIAGEFGEAGPLEDWDAENLLSEGLVDGLCNPDGFREHLERILRVVGARDGPPRAPTATALRHGRGLHGWEAVEGSRDPARPNANQVLDGLLSHQTWLQEGQPSGVRAALALVGGLPAVVVAQGSCPGEATRMGLAGLQISRRALRLASRLRLSVVTIVDTPGFAVGARSEQSGLALAAAEYVTEAANLTVPTVALLLGEGAGIGASALLTADMALATPGSWIAPIAPEGAAAVLRLERNVAPELARIQGIGSADLVDARLVDQIVEPADGDLAAGCRNALVAALEKVCTPGRRLDVPAHEGYRRRRSPTYTTEEKT